MSMRGLKNAFNVFLLVILLFGFAGTSYAKSYRSIQRKWTNHKEWFSAIDMSVAMLWHATYFSPEYRRAYEQEYIQRHYLDPVASARFIAEQEKDQAGTDEFFIGLYTRKSYKEFSLGKESFWQIVLVTDNGEEVQPIRIDLVPLTPWESILYPYLTRWSYGYRVVFPKANTGKKFTLILRSVLGATDLEWDY
ncbi:MAG: hypothetical protein Q7T03_01935 [Deltaproteobacteria bacterium]|nr:hypothetical protein [Deltaproteobacteria bacterium]